MDNFVPVVMVSLRNYLTGWDWLRLVSTCKSLRQYGRWNTKLQACAHLYEPRVFPVGLTKLDLKYDGAVINKLTVPDTLTALVIAFNEPVVKSNAQWSLPSSLRSLTISGGFNQSVIGWMLPVNLEELCFLSPWNQPVFDPISGNGWVLPPKLKCLDLGSSFCHPVFNTVTCKGWMLPSRLDALYMAGSFDHDVFSPDKGGGWDLPHSLRTLWLGKKFDRCVFSGIYGWRLPMRLRELCIGKGFRQLVISKFGSWVLPHTLEELTIGTSWHPGRNHVIPIPMWSLPPHLHLIRIGHKFAWRNLIQSQCIT